MSSQEDGVAVMNLLKEVLGTNFEAEPLHMALTECAILRDRITALTSEEKEKDFALEKAQAEFTECWKELEATKQLLQQTQAALEEVKQDKETSEKKSLQTIQQLRSFRNEFVNALNSAAAATEEESPSEGLAAVAKEVLIDEESLLNSNDINVVKDRLRSLHRERAYAAQEQALELQMEKDNFRALLREQTVEYENQLSQARAEMEDRESMILQLQEEIRPLLERSSEREVQRRTLEDYRILENTYLKLAQQFKDLTVEMELYRAQAEQQQQHPQQRQ